MSRHSTKSVRVWKSRLGDWIVTCETHQTAITSTDHQAAFEAALGHVAYHHPKPECDHEWSNRGGIGPAGPAWRQCWLCGEIRDGWALPPVSTVSTWVAPHGRWSA